MEITNFQRELAIVELVSLTGRQAGVDKDGQMYAAKLAALHFRIDPKSAWRAVKYGEKTIRGLMKKKVAA